MFCEKCGAEMKEGAAFCYVCGAPAHSEDNVNEGNQGQSKAVPTKTLPESNPQAAIMQPQTPYQQNTYQNGAAQGYYQQPSQFANLESTISTARTLGILSIVGALTITLAGLICGIIGLVKVKDLKVPNQLVERRDSAKRLNTIGVVLSAVLMVLAFILIASVGCSGSSYY